MKTQSVCGGGERAKFDSSSSSSAMSANDRPDTPGGSQKKLKTLPPRRVTASNYGVFCLSTTNAGGVLTRPRSVLSVVLCVGRQS